MSADVFVHCDELIWNCHWLTVAPECPTCCGQVVPKLGFRDPLGVTQGLLHNNAQLLFFLLFLYNVDVLMYYYLMY